MRPRLTGPFLYGAAAFALAIKAQNVYTIKVEGYYILC